MKTEAIVRLILIFIGYNFHKLDIQNKYGVFIDKKSRFLANK